MKTITVERTIWEPGDRVLVSFPGMVEPYQATVLDYPRGVEGPDDEGDYKVAPDSSPAGTWRYVREEVLSPAPADPEAAALAFLKEHGAAMVRGIGYGDWHGIQVGLSGRLAFARDLQAILDALPAGEG